jgi:hypothetical protein
MEGGRGGGGKGSGDGRASAQRCETRQNHRRRAVDKVVGAELPMRVVQATSATSATTSIKLPGGILSKSGWKRLPPAVHASSSTSIQTRCQHMN